MKKQIENTLKRYKNLYFCYDNTQYSVCYRRTQQAPCTCEQLGLRGVLRLAAPGPVPGDPAASAQNALADSLW